VSEKERLVEVAEALHGKMQYFDELDRVAAQFHGASLDVDSDRFLPLLQRLDDCISCACTARCSWKHNYEQASLRTAAHHCMHFRCTWSCCHG